ncbi:MAG: UvrD-helicase domain-containing protein [Nocardioides sp.]|nr:UvrD-helicase domain-containing protein [Nocardioides sp.]
MTFTPTDEQRAAVDAFAAGNSLTLTAGAGTGKTATLRLLAEAAQGRRGLYAAFNRAIATDAKGSFPTNVTVKTTHALAFAAVGHRFKDRLNGPRIPAQQVANQLGIRTGIKLGDQTVLQPAQQARLAIDMATRFCNSADPEVSSKHLAPVPGLDPADHLDVADLLLPYARQVWDDWCDPHSDSFKYPHDAYVKTWCLTNPSLGYDFLLFDECQDTAPVIANLVAQQQSQGTQIVVVGDPNQAIYGWRGAVDSMGMFTTDHALQLSQSFRFGPAVADEANKWLERIGGPLRLTGTDTIRSQVTVTPLAAADAVLCRTNAGTVSEVMAAHQAAQKVAIVGGGQDALRLAEAAEALQGGRATSHPELALFSSWAAVQDHVDQGDANDLRPFVRLIDEHGARVVIDAINKAVPEQAAERVVSTAHKAKGREWDSVQIHSDFPEPKVDPETGEEQVPGDEEAMLAYVAITRARRHLSRGTLAWVDSATVPASAPKPTTPTPAQVPGPAKVADPWAEHESDRPRLELTLDQDLARWLTGEAVARGTTPEDLVERLIRARREWTP